MSDPADVKTSRFDSAGRDYLMISLTALAVLLLVLLHWGLGRWSFIPVLIGLMGAIVRWRMAPLLTLIVLAALLLAGEATERPMPIRYPARGFSLSDWLLSGAFLTFCAAHYRLQAMTAFIFPPDRRRRSTGAERGARSARDERSPVCAPGTALRAPAQARVSRQQRSPRLVSPLEIGWLLVSIPIWAFLAQLCWRLLPSGGMAYELSTQTWRGMVLAWILVLGLLIVAGLLDYAGQRRMRDSEARLFLQDAVWQETGQEQRRLNRWLAWARLRRRRRDR